MRHNLAIFFVSWLVIYLLRAFPFIVCGRASGEQAWLKAAEKWLSPAVIAILIVYSYSGLEWSAPWPYYAGALVVLLQLVFKNGLLSIFCGTVLYMLLVA